MSQINEDMMVDDSSGESSGGTAFSSQNSLGITVWLTDILEYKALLKVLLHMTFEIVLGFDFVKVVCRISPKSK